MTKDDMVWHLVLNFGLDYIHARALLNANGYNLDDVVAYVIDKKLMWAVDEQENQTNDEDF